MLANPELMAGARKPSLGGRTIERDMYPSDLVGAARFFAGPDSAFITGQTLVVDGGTYFHETAEAGALWSDWYCNAARVGAV